MGKRITLILMVFYLFAGMPLLAKGTRIVILPFEKLNKEENPELDTLSSGISEILSQALSNVEDFQVIDTIRVKKYLLDNMEFQQSMGNTGEKNLEKLQKLAQDKLQGEYMVTGSFQKIGDQINLTAKFIKIDDGKIIKSVSVHGPFPQGIFDLQENLARKLIEVLKTNASEDEKDRVNDYINSTRNYEAYQLYLQGRREHLKYSMKDYPRAIEYYKKALKIDPKYALAWGGLCEIDALRGYQILYSGGKYQEVFKEAIEEGKKAVRLGENLYQTHRALALAYLNSSKFDEAEKAIEPGFKLNPTDPEILFIKAMLTNYGYKEMGTEGTESNKYIQKALSINPDLIVARWAYAHSLFTLNKYNEALIEYLKILMLNPDHAEALHSVALIYYHQEKYNDSIEYAKKAVHVAPEVPQHHYTLGLGYFQISDWENSEKELKEAILIKPDYENAIYTLGSAYFNEGNYKEAKKYYLRALTINPKSEDAKKQVQACDEMLKN